MSPGQPLGGIRDHLVLSDLTLGLIGPNCTKTLVGNFIPEAQPSCFYYPDLFFFYVYIYIFSFFGCAGSSLQFRAQAFSLVAV